MNNVVINVDSASRRKSLFFSTLLAQALKDNGRDVTQTTMLDENELESKRDIVGILEPEVIIQSFKTTESVYNSSHDFKILSQGINSLLLFDRVNSYQSIIEDYLLSLTRNKITVNIILAPSDSELLVNGVTYPAVDKKIIWLRNFYKDQCRFKDTLRYTLVIRDSIMASSDRDRWIEVIKGFVLAVRSARHKFRYKDGKISEYVTKYINDKMMHKNLRGFVILATNYKLIKRLGGVRSDKLESMYEEYRRNANL